MATPAALPPLPFNPGRVRTYLVRLPLFTRLVLVVILAFWLLELQTLWSVVQWGALIPNEIGIGTSMFDPRIHPTESKTRIRHGMLTDPMKISVPTQHLPVHPLRFLSRPVERPGTDTFD